MSANLRLANPHNRRPSAHFSPSVGLALGSYAATYDQQQGGIPPQSVPRGKTVKNLPVMQEILDRERDRVDGRVSTAGMTKYDLVHEPDVLGQQTQNKVFDPLAGNEQFSGLLMSVYKQDSLATSYLNQTMFSALYPRSAHNPATAENSQLPNVLFPLAGGLTFNRFNYAAGYGNAASPEVVKDTFVQNVDLLHEGPGRYQELSHWPSSLEKPSPGNLDVLQRINHERLRSLEDRIQGQRSRSPQDPSHLPRRRDLEQARLEAERLARQQKRYPSPSAEERLKQRNDHIEKFMTYLNSKGPRNAAEHSRFILDFDLYECTSPDPKRRVKEFYRVLPDER